jgi:hypothetical protein
MEAMMPVRELLKSVDLVWWPEFLLNHLRETADADTLTASLADLSGCD